MLYSSTNLQISLTVSTAEMFRTNGYDVYWHETGVREVNTAGLATPKGVITFTAEIPAIPEYIVRLKSGSSVVSLKEYEIAVPCFTLRVPMEPEEGLRPGLGHKEFEWSVEFNLDGFAEDSFQHKEIAALFRGWIKKEDTLSVRDYETDPNAPTELRPVDVKWVSVSRPELVHNVDAIRYYVSLRAGVSFTE